MASGAKQPTWYPPQPLNSMVEYWDNHFPLRLYNSLTRTKTPFIPIKGNRVLWYMCGPTVYDQTHLGHGRTYTCFDYVRRILEDYFGYEVELVMNITDIDDKIIIRSAENGWLKAHQGQSLPSDKNERAEVVLDWSSKQPVEENMKRAQELAKHWEKSFLEDLKSLGIKLPTVLTRVSEYIPEIIDFVQGIIDNGYGYESNGSIYFDTQYFMSCKAKDYGKLVPENVGQSELLAEGEGSLSSIGQSDKKHPNDFALWKKSKKGEPFWDSPWGSGRPGWHIECSAMASDTVKHVAGGKIDIHTGGIDLRFPHHDNEIAQAEAYFDFEQWVNYFVHTGHLHIQGLKMSKSLKNFVKIQEALMDNSPRQIRFLFLLHKYNVPMDYNDNTMNEAVTTERFFNEFFQNIKARLRELPIESVQKWNEAEKELEDSILLCKERVRGALCDDINTPLAIFYLQELAKEVNRYLASSNPHVSLLIRSAAEYITSIFKVFGVVENGTEVGFSDAAAFGGQSATRENIIGPALDVICSLRDEIRTVARSGEVSKQFLLDLCDRIRDEDLIKIGIRLEDRGGGKSLWKLCDPEQLKEERRKAIEEQKKKEELKRKRELEKQLKEAEFREKAKISPSELFRLQTDKYSNFDEQGIPTHDAAGEKLSKGQIKRLKKEQEKQTKLYERYHGE